MKNPAPRRLLVVDDSRLIVQVIRDYFTNVGYQVDAAADGPVALARIEANTPDVIVADILMPGMDGWQLYEEVRKRKETAETPFIFLSTETELPKRLRGFRIGADDYVTKPFEVEELHARIERSLGRREPTSGEGADGTEAAAFLAGSVEHLALPDLLQVLAMSGKTGVVRLRDRGLRGEIHFLEGEIQHASAGPVRGLKALYRMLAWEDAAFRFEAAGEGRPERSVEERTSNVLMDSMVALDDWRRWKDRLPPADTRLTIRKEARDKLKRGKVTPAVFDVVARVASGATVGELLDESPVPDGDLAGAICKLLDQGVLHTC